MRSNNLGETNQPTSEQSPSVGTQWSYETNLNDRRLKGILNFGAARPAHIDNDIEDSANDAIRQVVDHANRSTDEQLRNARVDIDTDSNFDDNRFEHGGKYGFAHTFQYLTTPENLITKITESAHGKRPRTWNYSYDDAYRLLTANPNHGAPNKYAYDPAGNLTAIQNNAGSAALNYNNLNQITSYNGVPYSHDANGNLLDDGVRTYKWDAENRLVGITDKASPSITTTFRYDGLGRRLAIVDTSGTTVNEVRQLWCGDTLCQGRDASDTVTRDYYAEGQFNPPAGAYYYGQDQLGSVRDVFAVQTGAKVASYDYDAYGVVTKQSGQLSTDFHYAGMYSHAQSGLYLTNFRAYDPRTGRFISRDPVGENGANVYSDLQGTAGGSQYQGSLFIGLATATTLTSSLPSPLPSAQSFNHLYAYVNGNPISFVDPLGLETAEGPEGPYSTDPRAYGPISRNPKSAPKPTIPGRKNSATERAREVCTTNFPENMNACNACCETACPRLDPSCRSMCAADCAFSCKQ